MLDTPPSWRVPGLRGEWSDGQPPPLELLEVVEIEPPETSVETEQLHAIALSIPSVNEVAATEPRQATSPADPTGRAMLGFDPAGTGELTRGTSAASGGGLAGLRSEQGRRLAVEMRGGTESSEEAVERALAWIVRHQMPDGGWSFDHRRGGNCDGRCEQPGRLIKARVAATSMALLPLLGAGYTHQQGKYYRNVQAGLAYLSSQMRKDLHGGDFSHDGGLMYSHGLAAIVLCEAYAMTRDQALMAPAQAAINYIVYCQDPLGGGWRYAPRMPGDTSVLGWQLMALKSAHMAYLQVPPQTVQGAVRFLDSAAQDGGAGYGYLDPRRGTPATTAVGILCRMYLGWQRDEAALVRAVEAIGELGPSANDMYYNYYATQVLHHYEGPLWDSWNDRMRDHLVNTQVSGDHAEGSWYFYERAHSEVGGRLYSTSLATMILEVYYRHMPLYSKRSTVEGFDP